MEKMAQPTLLVGLPIVRAPEARYFTDIETKKEKVGRGRNENSLFLRGKL